MDIISSFLSSWWRKIRQYVTDQPWERFTLILLLFSFLFIFPWLNFITTPYPLTRQFFVVIFWIIGCTIVALIGLIRGKVQIPSTGLAMVVSLFLLGRLLATAFSILPRRSIWGAYGVHSDSLIYYCCLVLLGTILVSLRLKRKEILYLLGLLFIQSTFLGLQVIGEALDLGTLEKIARPITPFTNATYYISYSCLLFPLGIAAFLWAYKYGRSLVLPALIGCQILIVALALIFSLPPELHHLLMPWASEGVTVNRSFAFLDSASNNERFTQWHLGMKIGNKMPLLGSGLGTSRAEFYTLTNTLSGWDYNVAMDLPHNDTIQQYSQAGIIGLLTYFSLIIGVAVVLWKRWKGLEKEEKYIIGSLGSGFILFLFFNQFLFTVIATGIFATVSLAVAISASQDRDKTIALSPSVVYASSLVMAILLLTTGFWTVRYLVADMHMATSTLDSMQGDFHGADSENQVAVQWFPYEDNYYRMAGGNGTYYILSAYPGFQSSTYPQAIVSRVISDANTAVTLNPYIPKHYLNVGIITLLLKPERTDYAFTNLQKAIELTPYDSSNYKNISDAMLIVGTADSKTRAAALMREFAPSQIQPYVEQQIARFNPGKASTP